MRVEYTPERDGHGVANVGEAEQHERDTNDGVQYRYHLALVRAWGHVPVP